MPQDDRKGQPPSTRGRAPAPNAPDTPSAREINAPPPPEKPSDQAQGDEGNPGAHDIPAAADSTAMAGDGRADPDAGERDQDQEPPTDQTEQLEQAVEAAKKALKAEEEKLARYKKQRAADQAAAAMVKEYKAQVPGLEAHERGLRQYQAAETSYLEEVLSEEARQTIADVAKAPRKKIDDLRLEVEQKEGEAADARRDLAEARAAADAAKQASEALKRPAASIKDRLKSADAVRSDAKKASDAGNYALAYWLIMTGGKLDRTLEAGQPIIPPETLATAIKAAAGKQAEADKAVADLEGRVAELDASLQKDRTELATLQRNVDATILTELAKLNPPSAEAA